ncbi:MAG: thioredoxin-disulfide reductase [Aquisalinus sp.]|nr:thioredoxin-disulfide reductase [Aquisalinus sp.]
MNIITRKTCWVISDGRAGMENQALGLAEAVSRVVPVDIKIKRISAKWPWGYLPSWTWGPDPFRKVGLATDERGQEIDFSGMLPDLWIACGRLTIPLSIKAKESGESFIVQTQAPRCDAGKFDLVIPPHHDQLSGETVFSLHGSPNRLHEKKLSDYAEKLRKALDLPASAHVVSVLIGGDSKAYKLDKEHLQKIIHAVQALANNGSRVLLTTSRRTGERNTKLLRSQLTHENIFIWNGEPIGDLANPYFGLLGIADHILVTQESTNMIAEAAFTGKPVSLLPMAGESEKFARFHRDLIDLGAIRSLSLPLQNWTYEPLRETDRAAREIVSRWLGSDMLPPLEPASTNSTYAPSVQQNESSTAMSDAPASKRAKVLIIGSGAAGYTAAIYAARAMLEPVLIKGLQPGGQLTITTDVENYPGFADVIQGPWLMEQMEKQAAHVGTEMIADIITDVDFTVRPFRLTGDSGTQYTADSVIIATGAQAKWLGLPSEQKFQGFGVSACATCDGFFYRGKEVAVVGGGNTAVEEALFLTNFASKVTLIHRRDSLRAERILQNRLLNHEKVEVIWDSEVEEVLGTEEPLGVTALRLKNVKTGERTDLPTHGFFVAIGHAPATEVFTSKVDMKENGYVITAPDSTATNIPGVFAAGDVTDDIYRQAVTAAGMGCMAALEAEKFIAEQDS